MDSANDTDTSHVVITATGDHARLVKLVAYLQHEADQGAEIWAVTGDPGHEDALRCLERVAKVAVGVAGAAALLAEACGEVTRRYSTADGGKAYLSGLSPLVVVVDRYDLLARPTTSPGKRVVRERVDQLLLTSIPGAEFS